ncbi:S-layer homology domain-containing protein [Brasilonema sp. UFV-L1]|uniref:S-layer homology domain-containing protein n=1 Tax=Brasilonema sp. UFV-L1 TaxID=2234130 RepID=UPI001B7D16F5|nr:S-layer homology domain-containing protein [Brasilonema sp. UFV-L1]
MNPSDPESSPNNTLGFDEFIGILVAFATIGVILFWSFSRKNSNWNFTGLTSPNPTSSASPVIPVMPSLPGIPKQQPIPFLLPGVKPTLTPSPTNGKTSDDELPPVYDLTPNEPSQAQDPFFSFPTTTTEQSRVLTPSEKLPTIPPPLAFTDVPAEFWGRRFIDILSSRGIIKGFPDYSFRPNQPVNRAEFAAILQQAFDRRNGGNTTTFKDTPADFWAIPAINQSITTGFLKGYPDNTFKPDQKIPRVQVLVALASGLDLKVPSSPEKVLSIYKDAKEIPQYALDKVAAATENRLVVNHPDLQVLAPNQEATRAEVAAMVHQALVRMGRLQPIESQSIVKTP